MVAYQRYLEGDTSFVTRLAKVAVPLAEEMIYIVEGRDAEVLSHLRVSCVPLRMDNERQVPRGWPPENSKDIFRVSYNTSAVAFGELLLPLVEYRQMLFGILVARLEEYPGAFERVGMGSSRFGKVRGPRTIG